jgi:hypothetical protein
MTPLDVAGGVVRIDPEELRILLQFFKQGPAGGTFRQVAEKSAGIGSIYSVPDIFFEE